MNVLKNINYFNLLSLGNFKGCRDFKTA